MVYLSRIYTKTGDQGETGLGNGNRVSKDHPRVGAYGSVDELNAVLGLFLAQISIAGGEEDIVEIIRGIQNDLFDVGADLCIPESAEEQEFQPLRVGEGQVKRLENLIDNFNGRLNPLKSFILPGGSLAAAWCHLARTVCRRAERGVVTLNHKEPLNPQVQIYLNRLSDLLFVLARVCNRDGKDDILWVPGKTAEKS